MHPLYEEPTNLSPLLDACYQVAKQAHAGTVRTKKAGDVDYITHPVIVCRILQAVGIEDELALGAAFLHDVIEDCKDLDDAEKLQAELTKQFTARNIVDADKKAHIISIICDELSNDELMLEGKRAWQAAHGHKLSYRAKLVKVADQAASLADDVMLASDRSYEQIHSFTMKARECAKSCWEVDDLLKKTFKVIFSDAMSVLEAEQPEASQETVQKAQAIRDNFSLKSVVERAYVYQSSGRDAVPSKWRKHPVIENASNGLVKIGITDDDKVCRFVALVSPHRDEHDADNKIIGDLIKALEKKSPHRVTYSEVDLLDGRVTRTYKLKPPIATEKFMELAAASAAIEPEFFDLINNPLIARRKEFNVMP